MTDQPCCDYRDHSLGSCTCPEHPQDSLHPLGGHDHDLRPAVAQAIAELDAEHRQNVVPDPERTYPRWKRPPNREGCVICWPKDGSWPCATRQVADDLRAALGEGGCTRPPSGWKCTRGEGHDGSCAAVSESEDGGATKESNRLATLRVLDLLRSPEMNERIAAVIFDLWTGDGEDDGMVPLAQWPKAIVEAVWSGLGEQ